MLISDAVDRHYGPALAAAAPGAERVILSLEGSTNELDRVEVVYFSGDLFPDSMRPFLAAVKQIPRMRWLHSFSAGVDNVFFERLLERGVRVTTSSGAMAVPIAQTVMLYLLALSRDLPGWLGDQSRRRWNPREIGDLQGRTLGVVGLGPIGLEVARLASAFRMRVVGVRRHPTGEEPCETRTLGQLPGLLPELDALVLAVPLSDETRHLIDREALAALKSGCLVVNIGRGELIDEVALVDALESGQVGGAGLDVFDTEPLPDESPLWRFPNVIVTPHSSGTSSGNFHRASEIFVENLQRYVRGEAMRNEVGVR